MLVALAALALALLAGGVADEQLLPGRWGELAAGIGRGISALPGARVPYRGLDEWTRLVIAPRRHRARGRSPRSSRSGRAARELGLRNVALVLLVTLYAVPAVALDLSSEFLSGALLALLVVAYLRLERLQITDAGAAGDPRGRGDDPRARRGARAGHRPAVVRLRDVGALQRLLEVDERSPGTTPTARWTGRATAASCCA